MKAADQNILDRKGHRWVLADSHEGPNVLELVLSEGPILPDKLIDLVTKTDMRTVTVMKMMVMVLIVKILTLIAHQMSMTVTRSHRTGIGINQNSIAYSFFCSKEFLHFVNIE